MPPVALALTWLAGTLLGLGVLAAVLLHADVGEPDVGPRPRPLVTTPVPAPDPAPVPPTNTLPFTF